MADAITTINDLIETLEDGRKGYDQGAERLADSNRPEVAETFRRMSAQRSEFIEEIRSSVGALRSELTDSGSTAAALHRGWMALKDALTSDDPTAVVKAALSGEEHALSEYDDALSSDDLPADLRPVLVRQRDAIGQARTRLETLAAA